MEISSEAYMKEFGGRYNVLKTCPLYEANFDFFEKTINRNGHEYCNISKITSIRSNKETLLNLTKCETEAIPIEDKVVSLKHGDADTIIIDGWNGGPLVLYPCPSYPTQN